MAAHLDIRDALAAVYGVATPLAGGRIHENREYKLARGVASCILVYRVRSLPVPGQVLYTSAPIDWLTELRTVVLARKDGDTKAEAVADPIVCEMYRRVMSEQSLGGLAMQLEPGAFEWDQDDEADTDVVRIQWDITVMHRTANNAI